MEITNYYTAQVEEQLTLRKFGRTRRGRPKRLGIADDDSIISKFPIGLWSYTRAPQKYTKLLEVWGIDKLSNKNIFDEFKALTKNSLKTPLKVHKSSWLIKNIPDLPNFKDNITIEEISEALSMYFSSSYSLDKIAFKYKVQKDILSHHIQYLKQVKHFKDWQKMKEKKIK